MRTYADLVSAIAGKMFMSADDLNTTEYNSLVERLINECLTMIANDLKPKEKRLQVVYKGEYNYPSDIDLSTAKVGDYYKVKSAGDEPHPVIGEIIEKSDIIWLMKTGEEMVDGVLTDVGEWVIERGANTLHIVMPEDFLSFSDYKPIFQYPDGRYGQELIFVSENTAKVPGLQTCTVFYNGLYPHVESGDDDLVKRGIPVSVMNVIPTYVASELLMEDDIQKATMYRNQFEILAARLETSEDFRVEEIRVKGGWL